MRLVVRKTSCYWIALIVLFFPSISWAMPWWDCSGPYQSVIGELTTEPVAYRVVTVEPAGNQLPSHRYFSTNSADADSLANLSVSMDPASSTAGHKICMTLKFDRSIEVNRTSIFELSLDGTSGFESVARSHENTTTGTNNSAQTSHMILLKSVCNATISSCDVLSGAGFHTEQSGKPNDEMIYRLEFISQLDQLQNVTVYDALPSYTTLKPFSAAVVIEPTGMTCSIDEPLDQSVPGYKGALKWNCSGQIAESHSGVVAFTAYID